MVLGVLLMLGATAFLAESLLLRVSVVKVTGDQIYPEEEIIKICGYKEGDNMLFLPDREKQLKAKMPYIAEVKVEWRFPGTVEIRITGAQAVCCLQAGAAWITLDGTGKVLQESPQADEQLLRVTGLTPMGYVLGQQVQLEDNETSAAFLEILRVVEELGAGRDFSRLDLSDLYDIRMWYQERVECRLGSAAELERKLVYGHALFDGDKEDDIGPQETGVLELSYLPERKRAFFEEGPVDPNAPPQRDPVVPPDQLASPQPEGASSDNPAGQDPGEDEAGSGGVDDSGAGGGYG